MQIDVTPPKRPFVEESSWELDPFLDVSGEYGVGCNLGAQSELLSSPLQLLSDPETCVLLQSHCAADFLAASPLRGHSSEKPIPQIRLRRKDQSSAKLLYTVHQLGGFPHGLSGSTWPSHGRRRS